MLARKIAVALLVLGFCLTQAAEAQRRQQTPWQKVQYGMDGQQVKRLLGPYTLDLGMTRAVVGLPATSSYAWHVTDWSKGFDRSLYFEVTFSYDARTRRWGVTDKRVDWVSPKWKGSRLYDHYDVTAEFR